MHPEMKEEFRVRRLQVVFDIAAVRGGVRKLCREFGIAKSTYYYWKKRYELLGKSGLYRHKPILYSSPRKTQPEVTEKVLELRNEHNMGPMKIVYYLKRYHGIDVSESTVYRILKAHGVSRLGREKIKRTTHSRRYSKDVPGHHIQMDVKFLFFKDLDGKRIKRFQCTAIDDATRIRALKVYHRHTQANAIDFFDYVVEKFPFRIKTIRTDRGHEFQAKFHWHVEDSGMEHVYIKPMTPQLNGKVERSHRTVLHMANRTFRTDQLMNYILTSLLLEISEEAYIKAQRSHINTIEENHFSEVLEWIRLNMRNNITLTEVANYFHYNPEYFSRIFKKNTKQTFIRYLMEIRLKKARDLLINTTMGIKEIAFYVGYNNPKYFMKAFKKSEQMTPSEYRSSMCLTHLNNL